jgi:hypothetical protein
MAALKKEWVQTPQTPDQFKAKFALWSTYWGDQVKELLGATGAIGYNEYPMKAGSHIWHGVCRGMDGTVKAVIEFDRDDRYPGRDREYWLIRLG